MKLLRISLTIDKNGFKWDEKEYDARQQNNFLIIDTSPDGEWHSTILFTPFLTVVADTLLPHKIEASTWCRPEDTCKAKGLINKCALTLAMQTVRRGDEIYSHL